MAEVKRYPAAKRFGARYGRRLKQKFAEVESMQKQNYPCPYCAYRKVRRLSVGIWQCRKCDSKFTSRAYNVSKKIVVQGPIEHIIEPVEQDEEYEEEEEIEVKPVISKFKKKKAPQEEEEEAAAAAANQEDQDG